MLFGEHFAVVLKPKSDGRTYRVPDFQLSSSFTSSSFLYFLVCLRANAYACGHLRGVLTCVPFCVETSGGQKNVSLHILINSSLFSQQIWNHFPTQFASPRLFIEFFIIIFCCLCVILIFLLCLSCRFGLVGQKPKMKVLRFLA